MKRFGKTAVFAAATAALASGVFATPATAAAEVGVGSSQSSTISLHTRGDGTQAPAELGDPKELGVVKLVLTEPAKMGSKKPAARSVSANSVSPLSVVQAGGGTWSYGWQARDNRKYCYSNYYHGSVKHSSTVNIAGIIVKDTKPAGQTTNANHTAGLAYTCYTYYAKY
ncbi:lactococcin 972 family bacteriocin [Streptomyces erythrochromogenes]|uniref:Lactococcin 972 family bacteriocin n=1 Tax=Streptomyces erythrochromogenes TaxID=285574 RepID=A0ABZ1QLQ4_9ACTN|nr:lactococcin 972 family bacteriocin [Streptomyces erythrochromogenes]